MGPARGEREDFWNAVKKFGEEGAKVDPEGAKVVPESQGKTRYVEGPNRSPGRNGQAPGHSYIGDGGPARGGAQDPG